MALTAALRRHLDNELAQAVALGRELARPSQDYPETVRRAMEVAYATHFRTVLEFFHDGGSALRKKSKFKRRYDRDIQLADLVPASRMIDIRPTARDVTRFNSADKLAAHLSKHRAQYHRSKQSWGNDTDRRAIERRIRRLFREVPESVAWLPETARALPANKAAV